MESIEKMSDAIEAANAKANPDAELVATLLGKVADLQTTIVEVVEIVSKIQMAETKETSPDEPPDEPPDET